MTNKEAIKQMIDMLAYYTTLNANHRADPLFDVVNNRKDMIALSMAIKALEQEPKTGTWEEDIDNNRKWDKVRFYCSECGHWQTYGKTDFCPKCGARMVESKESEDKSDV